MSRDDFPEEQTDPAMVRPPGSTGAHGAVSRPFPNDPSGAIPVARPVQGAFPNPPTGQHATSFPNPPTGQHATSFPNPTTGSFQTHGAPNQAFPAPNTGVQPIIRNNTSHGMQSVQPASKPEEFTPAERAKYGMFGFGAGAVIGLLLGLMNSALEDVSMEAGLPLTIQIVIWFGLVVGVVAAWHPERFDAAWARIVGDDD